MIRHRLPLVIAGAALLPLALTACEKPNPGATVFSGTSSQFSQAACWAFDEGALDADSCAQDVIEAAAEGSRTAAIRVVPGQVIGISVDPVVADAGWSPRVNGQNLVPSPITSTYFRFTFPEFQEISDEGLLMEIVAGRDDVTRGIWIFKLVT